LHESISVGDMIFVRGTGGLLELGTAGGFLGHVMLVVQPVRMVHKDSDDGHLFANVWPKSSGCQVIWVCRTVEATRQRRGLHEADLLLHCNQSTGKIRLIGEVGEDEVLVSGEAVEVWQSPEELRRELNEQCPWVKDAVLEDMKNTEASWSWETAVRAVLRSATGGFDETVDRVQLMRQVRASWKSDPICTSIIIQFWQRALEKFALEGSLRPDGATPSSAPAELIIKYLPLKADRSLPGDLLETMLRKGWMQRTKFGTQARARLLAPPAPSKRDEGQETPEPQQPPVSRAKSEFVIAAFCSRHSSSEKRPKAPQYDTTCQLCGEARTTNYRDFALCTECSAQEQRCQCCGVGVRDVGMVREATAPSALDATCAQQPVDENMCPRYCNMHGCSSQRAKAPQARLFKCAECEREIRSTYVEVALCGPCSNKQEKCMICGFHAPEASGYLPPAEIAPSLAVAVPLNHERGDPCGHQALWPPSTAPDNIYCAAHSTKERRRKGPHRNAACTGCGMNCTVNFAEFCLCPRCSKERRCCAICGANAALDPAPAPPAAASPLPAASVASAVGAAMSPAPLAGVTADGSELVAPRFCRGHKESQQRRKAAVALRECRGCRRQIETTYEAFSHCQVCSNKEGRCMICGGDAPEAGSYVPPTTLGPASAVRTGVLPGASPPFAACGAASPTPSPPPSEWAQPWRRGSRPDVYGVEGMRQPNFGVAIPRAVPAAGPESRRFCAAHGSSALRPKRTNGNLTRECADCGASTTTNYQDHTLCPACSGAQDRCMLCGAAASGGVTPPAPPPAVGGATVSTAADMPAQAVESRGFYPGPRYCGRHSASEARPKMRDVRSLECTGCGQSIDTNLAEFSLCAMCCLREQRCMVCGGGAPDEACGAIPAPAYPAAAPQRSAVVPGGGGQHRGQNSVEYVPQGSHAAPRFCARHGTSERRVKAQDRQVKCMGCRMELVTNYKEFSFCNSCSSGQEMCMICGSTAPQVGFYVPPAARLS